MILSKLLKYEIINHFGAVSPLLNIPHLMVFLIDIIGNFSWELKKNLKLLIFNYHDKIDAEELFEFNLTHFEKKPLNGKNLMNSSYR